MAGTRIAVDPKLKKSRLISAQKKWKDTDTGTNQNDIQRAVNKIWVSHECNAANNH